MWKKNSHVNNQELRSGGVGDQGQLMYISYIKVRLRWFGTDLVKP